MDANLSISSSSAATALSGAASQAASGAAPAGAELRAGDFADLFRGLQEGLQAGLSGEGERQDLAAAGLAEAGLQAVALSPQLELITAATPVPDADSLMAFARTQGLDDGTLAMLFGGPGATALVGQGASLLTAAAVPAAWALGASSLSEPGTGTAATGLSLVASGSAGGASVLAAQAGALGLSDVSWQVSKTGLGAGATAEAAAAATATAEADTPDTLAEALRLQLQMPREAITALTRRLAGLAGNGQAVAWGQLQAQALADSPEVLNMREFFSGQGALIEAVPEAGTPGSSLPALEAGRSAASGLTLQADNPAQASQAGARIEHYQQLADKLGQALAQRLQAQIERGEWKLQMRMDPASLGRIDLELDMRAGGLDAVFRSDNALTRELIAQGLPKLRDSLSQSGTTVAHVWVNGDSAGQPGGNPTPQFASPQQVARDSSTASAPQAPALPAAPAKRVSDSDWDVLA